MSITLSSTGGEADPYSGEGGIAGDKTFPNAVYENTFFTDSIVVIPESPATAVTSITVTPHLQGNLITVADLVGNSSTEINVTYNAPSANANILSQISISTVIVGGQSTTTITGNVSGSFVDSFWSYFDFDKNTKYSVNAVSTIPDGNVSLFLLKPSFMRYVNIFYDIEITYDTGVESDVLLKRVLNDWGINKTSLIQEIADEESRRSLFAIT